VRYLLKQSGVLAVRTFWGFLAVRLPMPEDKQWAADRATIQCHSVNFARGELEKGDGIIKGADRLMAEGIRTVAGLRAVVRLERNAEGPDRGQEPGRRTARGPQVALRRWPRRNGSHNSAKTPSARASPSST